MRILLLTFLTLLTSCTTSTRSTVPIPELDSKGDVYKTEGENDPLIYGSTVGKKKTVILYVDFIDSKKETDTKERVEILLGEGLFQKLFYEQSHGKLTFDIKHVHGWRTLPKPYREYNCRETETHRDLFVEVFKLYPEINFLDYDYIVLSMARLGNFAFGARDEDAIPYKGKKINVALNLSSRSPYVLAHEIGHLMGLPDVYTYGGLKELRNPAGAWDIMSSARSASGFIGWHRHKLNWLDADRKTYLTKGKHKIRLTPLNSSGGISMVTVPFDNAAKPSKVYNIEIAQPYRTKKGPESPQGILVYSVDATVKTGMNPIIVHPKETSKNAPFTPGDTFKDAEAPLKMTVLEKHEDGSYTVEVEVVRPSLVKKNDDIAALKTINK